MILVEGREGSGEVGSFSVRTLIVDGLILERSWSAEWSLRDAQMRFI
jgi:hypothetical protein